jgi:hypothetical protein
MNPRNESAIVSLLHVAWNKIELLSQGLLLVTSGSNDDDKAGRRSLSEVDEIFVQVVHD